MQDKLILSNWKEIKENVRTDYHISDVSFSTWIAPLEVHRICDGSVIYVVIPSNQELVCKYISGKYKNCFQTTIQKMYNFSYEIRFILQDEAQKQAPLNPINASVFENGSQWQF